MSNESCIGANIFAGMLQEKAPTGTRDYIQNIIQAAMRPDTCCRKFCLAISRDRGRGRSEDIRMNRVKLFSHFHSPAAVDYRRQTSQREGDEMVAFAGWKRQRDGGRREAVCRRGMSYWWQLPRSGGCTRIRTV